MVVQAVGVEGLFGAVEAAGAVAELVGDSAWVRAMLDVEVALAGACAEVGLVPVEHAAAVAAAASNLARYDPVELGRQAAAIGNPVGPLVRALTAAVAAAGEDGGAAEGGAAAGAGAGSTAGAAGVVHLGATSQDVLDTAAMLIARRVLDVLVAEVDAAAGVLAGLAVEHVGTVQVGRTLLQHAPPVTFGLTAAGWLAGLDAAADGLRRVRAERLAVQLGGASGTLAVFGADGPRVLAAMSARLGLAEPTLPWHTERGRIAELAAALAQTCGAVASIARDLVLLASTEVGEVSEDGPAGSGGSSTMPHKRNPIASVAALAAAAQAPGLAATLFSTMAHEHQRAAGAWHAEWRPLRELSRCTGSAVAWLGTALARLQVHPDRMRANLDLTGGLILAERITAELAPLVGRLAAHDAVTACCARATGGRAAAADPTDTSAATDPTRPADAIDGDRADVADLAAGARPTGAAASPTPADTTGGAGGLVAVLAGDPLVGRYLGRERIAELLDPAGYLGSAAEFVRRAVSEHERRAGR